ncbi:acyltransferase family protein [Dehalobacter sp. DCM]|uniref:acyltransferase family protein n=1 Tax=Dehalobacter sp. DCM TaxID=2907827 RepID=UPI003081701B|nr:acyltransferase family protein [Dehalobacter sp. DCM]
MRQRDVYFDNAKLLLIILVVLGHAIEPLTGDPFLKAVYAFIYSFHMPLFIFISGYFSKNTSHEAYATKIISKLVIPYLIFETLYRLLDFFVTQKESIQLSYLTPYWIMWFLLSLILWKVALPYIIKVRYALPITLILGILAGYSGEFGYYASLSRTAVFFPFFLGGYYFEKEWLSKFFHLKYRLIGAGILISVLLTYIFLWDNIPLQWFYGSTRYAAMGHPEWYAGIYRAGLYVLSTFLGLAVLLLVPHKQVPYISEMGKNTMYPYLIHGLIRIAIYNVGLYSIINTAPEKILLVIGSVALTLLLSLNRIRVCLKWLIEPELNFLFRKKPVPVDPK